VLEVGAIVAGKLRIERVLGAGGMGVVAVATHVQLEQRVAVKVLHDHLAADRDLVARFLREARAAARLRSDHVCRVSDVGELQSGAPYMVMELLEGRDLATAIATESLPIDRAVDYVLQACVALAEAHAQGIVHRDLKPANLFVTTRIDGSPLIKVLDFGIAKAPVAAGALTQTDAVIGTPGYMSPEQLRSARDVDVRADVWALGVILYQAVSGRLPFPGTTLTEVAVKIAMDPPEPLEVAPAFRDVVFRCLEKDPARRFSDVRALAEVLAPLGGASAAESSRLIAMLAKSSGIAETLPAGLAARTPPALPPTVATTLQSAASAAAAPAAPKPRRALLIGGGFALVGALAFGIAVVMHVGGAQRVAARDAATPSATTTAETVAIVAPNKPVATQPVPPAPTAPSSTQAEFRVALATHHCKRALELARQLGSSYIVESMECLKKRGSVLGQLSDPAAEPWVQAVIDEFEAAGKHANTVTLLDQMYAARAIRACQQHDATEARDQAAKITGPLWLGNAKRACGAEHVDL
jgi:serine/threonine-protein kinase